MKHPLLNPESTHYQMVDGVEAIERLEQMYTEEDLAAWAKITAMKYRMRIGSKDEPYKEMGKIETYEAYYKYLIEKIDGEHPLQSKMKLTEEEEAFIMEVHIA